MNHPNGTIFINDEEYEFGGFVETIIAIPHYVYAFHGNMVFNRVHNKKIKNEKEKCLSLRVALHGY